MEALHPKNEKLRELFVTEICEISAPKCIHMKNLQLCAVDMHWISVSLQTSPLGSELYLEAVGLGREKGNGSDGSGTAAPKPWGSVGHGLHAPHLLARPGWFCLYKFGTSLALK